MYLHLLQCMHLHPFIFCMYRLLFTVILGPNGKYKTIHAQVDDKGPGWWRGTVVERRSLTGELSLSCARPAADG